MGFLIDYSDSAVATGDFCIPPWRRKTLPFQWKVRTLPLSFLTPGFRRSAMGGREMWKPERFEGPRAQSRGTQKGISFPAQRGGVEPRCTVHFIITRYKESASWCELSLNDLYLVQDTAARLLTKTHGRLVLLRFQPCNRRCRWILELILRLLPFNYQTDSHGSAPAFIFGFDFEMCCLSTQWSSFANAPVIPFGPLGHT